MRIITTSMPKTADSNVAPKEFSHDLMQPSHAEGHVTSHAQASHHRELVAVLVHDDVVKVSPLHTLCDEHHGVLGMTNAKELHNVGVRAVAAELVRHV